MADPQGFGTGSTVQTLGSAAQDAANELQRLTDLVNSDVVDTVPNLWGGEAASSMTRWWYRFSKPLNGLGSPLDTYSQWLDAAAETMNRARRELQEAHRFADQNGLYIRPDLTVAAYVPNRPNAGALIVIAQSKVDGAKRLAELSQKQVRQANEMLEKRAVQAQQELLDILGAVSGPGRRGGRRPGTPRPRTNQDDQLEWGPEGRIRLPRRDAGQWVEGQPGHGVWTPHRPGDYGLLPGQSIRWRDGVPDLAEHRVPFERMPGGVDPTLSGMRLTGTHATDSAMADRMLADRIGMGWTPDRVRAWRLDNDFLYHHYSSSELQLVPGRVHRALPHQGGASEAR